MTTIYKYPFKTDDEFVIEMPANARILAVQTQCEQPCMWCIVDVSAPTAARLFRVYATGEPIQDLGQGKAAVYIGTYQLGGGVLIFHVFEVITK
jgi:hypothetical protein